MPKGAKQSGRRTRQKRSESEPPQQSEWTPSEQERAALARYGARTKALGSASPRIKIVKGETTTEVSLDHPKKAVGYALLAQAFGVTRLEMATGLVDQLVAASQRNGEYNEQSANFMAAVVESIKPRDELEAMLAAQMAAVHVATMTFARRLAGVEDMPQQDSAERAFNKLTRTFTTQLEALKRYRSGGEQKVTVQHIDVRGGQAIVGDVTQANRPPAPAAGSSTNTPALIDAKATPIPIPIPIPSEPAAQKLIRTKRK